MSIGRAMVTVACLVACVALAVAGCGGSGDESATPESLAARIGCTDTYQADDDGEFLARDAGWCRVTGAEVHLLTFGNNDGRDAYETAGVTLGRRYVKGDRWLIDVPSADISDIVELALGR